MTADKPIDDQNLAALARSSIGGKKTNYLKAACSDELKEALERRLRQLRMETGLVYSESQFVENAVAIALFGFDHVVKVQQDHLRKAAGFWSIPGQQGGDQP